MKNYTFDEMTKIATCYTVQKLRDAMGGRETSNVINLIDNPTVIPEHKQELAFVMLDLDDIKALVPVLIAKARELHGQYDAQIEKECAVLKHANTSTIEEKWIAGAEFAAKRALASDLKVARVATHNLASHVASKAGWDDVLETIKKIARA